MLPMEASLSKVPTCYSTFSDPDPIRSCPLCLSATSLPFPFKLTPTIACTIVPSRGSLHIVDSMIEADSAVYRTHSRMQLRHVQEVQDWIKVAALCLGILVRSSAKEKRFMPISFSLSALLWYSRL